MVQVTSRQKSLPLTLIRLLCLAERAQTTNTSATGALEIQVLVPESRNTPAFSSQRARLSMPATLEPWLGSVRPKQPTFWPAASCGMNFCFCSSLPESGASR